MNEFITPREVLDIYHKHGRATVNENIVRALAEAMNLAVARVAEKLVEVIAKNETDHTVMTAALLELASGNPTTTPQQPQTARYVCYCGTIRNGTGACPVCTNP